VLIDLRMMVAGGSDQRCMYSTLCLSINVICHGLGRVRQSHIAMELVATVRDRDSCLIMVPVQLSMGEAVKTSFHNHTRQNWAYSS
jgi:hypothetical protein